MASESWARQELPGLPNFEVRPRRGNVCKTAMPLVRESQREPLSMYADNVHQLSDAYGSSCWGIIYTTDVRVRRE
eukprot:5923950-Alexandrium_andersonii.AAC.1